MPGAWLGPTEHVRLAFAMLPSNLSVLCAALVPVGRLA